MEKTFLSRKKRVPKLNSLFKPCERNKKVGVLPLRCFIISILSFPSWCWAPPLLLAGGSEDGPMGMGDGGLRAVWGLLKLVCCFCASICSQAVECSSRAKEGVNFSFFLVLFHLISSLSMANVGPAANLRLLLKEISLLFMSGEMPRLCSSLRKRLYTRCFLLKINKKWTSLRT